MRTLTTAQRKILEAPSGHRSFCRARVSNDSGTTWVDLRSLHGRDFFAGATWGETVDQTMGEAHVLVRREIEGWSLSPDMSTSPLNLESGTSYPLLQKGYTLVQIQTASAPLESEPSTWRTCFTGVLANARDGGDGLLDLFLRDRGEYLMRTFIEEERQYGADLGRALEYVLNDVIADNETSVPRWSASTAYTVGQVVQPTPAGRTWYTYEVTAVTTGLSAGTEPVWPTPSGSVVDGGVTWTLTGAVPWLTRVPSSPGWDVGPFLQKSEPLLTALETLAMQIGWVCRFRFPATGESGDVDVDTLTLYSPDRDSMVSQYTLLEAQVRAPAVFDSSTDYIRNAIEIPYLDKDDLDSTGSPKPKRVLVDKSYSDPTIAALALASEGKYGRRFMRYAPGAGANIDTQAEAERLGVAALLDLCEPMAEVELEVPFLFFVQLHDVLTLPADGVHHDTDLVLSVTGFSHKMTDMKASTTLSLRGRPMVARSQWLHRAAQPGVAGSLQLEGPDAVENLELEETAGGFTLAFTRPTRGRALKDVELHISSSSSFTPDDSTFYQKLDGDTVTVTDLAPGLTRYAKIVGRDVRGNRGEASSEVTLTTRYVEPRTLQPYVVAAIPRNGSLEAVNVAGQPPDAFTFANGTWGTDAEVVTDAYSGGKAVRFNNTGADPALSAQAFTVRPGEVWVFSVFYKQSSGSALSGVLAFTYLDAAMSAISAVSVQLGTTAAANTWTRAAQRVAIPANARYAVLSITKESGFSGTLIVDGIDSLRTVAWGDWTAVSYANSWSDANAGVYGEVRYRNTDLGEVEFRGVALAPTPAPGAGANIFTSIPVGIRPADYARVFDVVTGSGAPARVIFATTGAVTVSNITAGDTLSFDGLRFFVD